MSSKQVIIVEQLEPRTFLSGTPIASSATNLDFLGYGIQVYWTINHSTLPTSLAVGSQANGVMNISLYGDNLFPTPGPLHIYVEEARDDASTSSLTIGTAIRDVGIRAGGVYTANIAVHIGRQPFEVGDYGALLFLSTPKDSSGDSFSATLAGGGIAPQLTISPPKTALAESVDKSSIPATITTGSQLTGSVTLSITNEGNFITPGRTKVSLFATEAGIIDSTAVKLATKSLPLRIKVTQSMLLTLPVRRVPSVPPGTYTILAQVTDTGDQLTSVVVGSLTVTT